MIFRVCKDVKSPCKIASLQLPRILFGELKRFAAPGIQLPKPASASVFLAKMDISQLYLPKNKVTIRLYPHY